MSRRPGESFDPTKPKTPIGTESDRANGNGGDESGKIYDPSNILSLIHI